MMAETDAGGILWPQPSGEGGGDVEKFVDQDPVNVDGMKRLASLDVVAYHAPQEHTRGQRRREERPAMDHIGMDVHKKEKPDLHPRRGGRADRAADPHRTAALRGGAR